MTADPTPHVFNVPRGDEVHSAESAEATRVPEPNDSAISAEERLRQITSVTDTALTSLDVEALRRELLQRARKLLEADTAAVLLYDEQRRQLVAVDALGIEEEVRLREPRSQRERGPGRRRARHGCQLAVERGAYCADRQAAVRAELRPLRNNCHD